eukprot:jgi/Bigna1/82429/fgenesh1_pg.92_\
MRKRRSYINNRTISELKAVYLYRQGPFLSSELQREKDVMSCVYFSIICLSSSKTPSLFCKPISHEMPCNETGENSAPLACAGLSSKPGSSPAALSSPNAPFLILLSALPLRYHTTDNCSRTSWGGRLLVVLFDLLDKTAHIVMIEHIHSSTVICSDLQVAIPMITDRKIEIGNGENLAPPATGAGYRTFDDALIGGSISDPHFHQNGYGGTYAQIPLLLLLCACTTVPTVLARGHGYFNGIHEKTTEKVHGELLSREIRLRNRHVKLVWDQEKAWRKGCKNAQFHKALNDNRRADGESEARLDHELERIQASLNDKDGFATGLWILALKGPITHKLKERIEECLPPAIRLDEHAHETPNHQEKENRRLCGVCTGDKRLSPYFAQMSCLHDINRSINNKDKFDGDSAKALVKAAHGHAPIGLFFYIHDTIEEKERAALEGAVRNSLEALCGERGVILHRSSREHRTPPSRYRIAAGQLPADNTHRAKASGEVAQFLGAFGCANRREVGAHRSSQDTSKCLHRDCMILEERNYYWENGLYGEGQVIGLSDTGIDHDHCFFYDGSTPTPLNKVDMGHRKIVYYKTFRDGEDHKGGHGTPIAGSLAGKAICPATTQGTFECEGMQRMNGMASEAKIAFIDLQSKTDKELVLPKDMYKDVYKDLYTKTGARIHSGSWGNPAIHGYDTTAYQLDKFAYDNLDFVHIVAAGNGGEKGFETLDSPGIAKNAITVGSCRSFESSFHYVGLGLGYDVTNPPNVRGIYITSPAKIGDYFGQIVLESEVVWAEPQMACSPLTNADQARGKIIFVRRGQCEFDVKAVHVTAAGGRIMLIVNNKPGDPVVASGDGFYNISVAMIRQDDGELLSQYIGKGLRIKFPADDMAPLNLLYSDAFMSNFSSKGPTRDGRIKPDIVAPGEYITSSESDGNTETYQCHEFNGLVSMVGTSLATPQESGFRAVVSMCCDAL